MGRTAAIRPSSSPRLCGVSDFFVTLGDTPHMLAVDPSLVGEVLRRPHTHQRHPPARLAGAPSPRPEQTGQRFTAHGQIRHGIGGDGDGIMHGRQPRRWW
jgi:hypothetical protein